MKEVKETKAYLDVKMTEPGKFRAILTEDGKTIYNNSTYDVQFISGSGRKHIKAEIHGEFICDFDMKLEALSIMRWIDERRP